MGFFPLLWKNTRDSQRSDASDGNFHFSRQTEQTETLRHHRPPAQSQTVGLNQDLEAQSQTVGPNQDLEAQSVFSLLSM